MLKRSTFARVLCALVLVVAAFPVTGFAQTQPPTTPPAAAPQTRPTVPAQAPAAPAQPPPQVPAQPPVPAPPPQPVAPPTAFGYDIFRQDAGPIAEGPVDEQFILSPGDEVVISVWGQLNLLYNLVVSEEGYVELPEDGGRIHTNGVTLRDLKARVTQALSLLHASYINAEDPAASTAFVDVRLGKVRKLLLYVVGEVRNPGAYTLSSGTATVINLLNNAGGVKESGTLRQIQIRRATGRLETIDLYDFLLTGKLDVRMSRLLTGDYVVVPLKQKAVTVKGEIRRPLTYEVIGREGLKELVSFAGGFTPNAYLLRSQMKRLVINRGEVFLDVNLDSLYADPSRNYPLVDRDELTVLPNIQVRKSMVTVSGDGVTRPGTYEFSPGMTLNDLIRKAEGLREYAYLDRADLVRTEGDFSKKLTTFSLRDLYTQLKPGVFTFSGNAQKNFELKEMDSVAIYSEFGMAGQDKFVTIEGHVKLPGRTLLAKGMTLFDLVFAKGGFQDKDFRRTAFPDLAHVLRKVPGAIGLRIIPFNLARLIDGDAAVNFSLEEEDVVRVYRNEQMTVKAKVEISGLVNRPGTFDLSENLTVEDLIVLAGGLRADAYKVEAVVARAEGLGSEDTTGRRAQSTIRVPVDVRYYELAADKKTPLKAFDKVTLRNLPGWEPMMVVSLQGEVRYPGDYALESRQERISSLISRAEGLRKEALPEGATVRRRRSVLMMAPGASPETFEITLDLAEALKTPGGEHDLILKDGDTVFIPSNPGTVEVRGAVRRPLILQHNPNYDLDDYISLCGGYLEVADKDNTVVFAANNAVTQAKHGRWPFSRGAGVKIAAGSTIEVPFTGEATRMETVEVRGAVLKPAMMQHIQGSRLGYYLNLAGGYTKDADLDKVAIHTPNGDVLLKQPNTVFNPVVPPGSTIVVTSRTTTEAK